MMLNDLGVAYAREARYEEALRVWSQSAGLAPNGGDSHYNAAHVLIYNLNRPADALPLLRRALAIAPDWVDAQFLNALVYQGIGNLRQAFTQYEQLLAVVTDRADILFNMASICVEMGDKAQAVTLLERVIKVKPSAQIYMQLGILCDEIGQHQQAQAYGGKAIDLYPDAPQAAEIRRLRGIAD